MTAEEQWTQINYPSFMAAAIAEVKTVEQALDSVSATGTNITANVNDVPIVYNVTENRVWVTIQIGLNDNGSPQVELYIPYVWVMG